MVRFLEKKYILVVAIILGFMAVVSVLNAWWDSAIFDETAHIGAAYTYVTEHQIRLNPEHPPLIKDLAGLPLLFLNLKLDINQPFWTGELPHKWDEGQWAAGRSLLYQSGNNPDLIIFWSRIPIILLSLLLGWFIFFWAKKLAGTIAGLFALALYAFDPNILGHNHFVTTDLGIAAFFTFAFYFFLKFIKDPTWKNTTIGGIFLGLLFLAKFSFLVALPIFGLVLIIYPLVRINRHRKTSDFIFKIKKLGEYLVKGIVAFMIAMVLVWIIYFVNIYKMPKEIISQSIDFNFSTVKTDNVKDYYTNQTLHLLNSNVLTRPLTIWGEGIGYVFRRVAGGNGAYFMGQVSGKAFPAYFPTVFMIKEPIPMLVFILMALLISLVKISKAFWENISHSAKKLLHSLYHYLRVGIVEISLLFFILLYAYVSITGNLNIGFRHLFPILPFIYILTAKSIVEFWKRMHRDNRFILTTFIVVLGVYLIGGTIYAYPSYMSYFNEAAGGPKNGYHYVTDSNADWGQDLKRLKVFLDGHPEIYRIRVDYFGGGDVKYYIGDKYLMWWDSKRPIEAGWYAISTNFLMGSIYSKENKDADSYRWLIKLNKKPVYQVGTSILIFSVTPADLKSLQK